jgi:Family of unknown function (DUF5677)
MPAKRIFGYPEEWKAFECRNAKFLEGFPLLQRALDAAFVREFTTTTPAERTVHFLGRLCIEDFMELLCLAVNGYGIGALKLLRGLYERVVTASYIADHPSEADLFLDFRFISRHRALQSYVDSGTKKQEWVEAARTAKDAYDRIKHRFEIDSCKKCGTKKINHTWSKLDFASMAKLTAVGKLLAQAYYEPLNHSHSTSEAMFLRLKTSPREQIIFDSEPQPNEADRALMVAHALMLELVGVQARYFNLPELEKLYEECANDHVRIWRNRKIAIKASQ